MSRKPVELKVNPDVLKWARESSGFEIDELSNKIKSDTAMLYKLEQGKEQTIRLSILRRLAQLYKISLETLLLPTPPDDSKLLTNFRNTSKELEKLKRPTRLALRKARYLQNVASNLIQENNVSTIAPEADPVDIANYNRSFFEESENKPAKPAFIAIRKSIEDKGIFVFQMRLQENIKGFSIIEKDKPPIIVINSADMDFNSKKITLFHEYAHIMLNNASMCNPIHAPLENYEDRSEGKIEEWCNKFALDMLQPKRKAEDQKLKIKFSDLEKTPVDGAEFLKNVSSFSRKLHTNNATTLLNLFYNKTLSNNTYKKELDIINKKKERKKNKPFVSKILDKKRLPMYELQVKRCYSEKGGNFVDLILQGMQDEKITANDVLDCLSLKLEGLKLLENS